MTMRPAAANPGGGPARGMNFRDDEMNTGGGQMYDGGSASDNKESQAMDRPAMGQPGMMGIGRKGYGPNYGQQRPTLE